jgi:hypothetical protein
MREASGTKRGPSPTSLRDRLALLECGILPVSPRAARAGARPRQVKPGRPLVGASFAFGLACGGVLGCAPVLAFLLFQPSEVRSLVGLAQSHWGSLGTSPPDFRQQIEHGKREALSLPTFELTIAPGDGGNAALPLRVVGVDRADNVELVLRDVPTTVRLAGGARRDDHTWAVRMADLDTLRLVLGTDAPDAFEMRIEVASAGGGTPIAEAVARVHVLDQQQVAASTGSAPLLNSPDVGPGAAGPSPPAVDTPFRTEVTEVPKSAEPTRAAQSRLPLPEGLSSLGGPTDGRQQPQEGRLVWWRLPQPVWSPFSDNSSGN